jgi:uncharacterized protein (UPF0261 family)
VVRIAVDLNRCQGYAQCAFLAPEIFAMHGEEALLYDPEADEALFAALRQDVDTSKVELVEVDADVNDPAFATAMDDRLHQLIGAAG